MAIHIDGTAGASAPSDQGQGQEPQRSASAPPPPPQQDPDADLEAVYQSRRPSPPEPYRLGGAGPVPQGGVKDDQDLEAEWQRRKRMQEQTVLQSLAVAAKSDPDLAAKAFRISQDLGLPADTISEDQVQDVWRVIARQRAVMRMDLTKVSPRLAERLGDFEFARQAHDDLENLSTWEVMAGRFKVAELQTELGHLASQLRRGATGEGDLPGRIAKIRQQLRELPQEAGFLGEASYFVGQYATMLPKALAIGTATGAGYAGVAAALGQAGPQAALPEEAITMPGAFLAGLKHGTSAALLLQSFETESGLDFLRMLDAGYDQETAAASSRVTGAVKAGLELVGISGLARPFLRKAETKVAEGLVRASFGRAVGTAVKDYGIGIGSEAGTEALQTLVEDLGENIAFQLRESKTGLAQPPGAGQMVENALQSALQVAKGMVLIGALPAASRFGFDMRQAASADQRARLFEKFVQAARDSKLAARNPDAFEQFAKATTEGTSVEDVFVAGSAMAEAMRQSDTSAAQLDAIVPGLGRQVAEAVKSGGDVVIPTATYAAKIVTSELGKFLQPHIRQDPDGMSLTEAEAYRQQIQQEQAAMVAGVIDQVVKQDATKRSRRSVEASFESQLIQARAMPPRAARAAAGFWGAFVETQAKRLGWTPEQFAERFPIRVGLAEPGTSSGGRGSFDFNRLLITLERESDTSTILHELGHAFLSIYGDIAAQPNAPEQVRADLQAFVASEGIGSIEAWRAMTEEQQKPHHEGFALRVERWLFEGTEPSLGLRRVFQRIADWMRHVYRGVLQKIGADYEAEFGRPLPALTPELRGILSRMVSSEAAVSEAETVRAAVPLFQTKEQALASGMGEDEWQALQESQQWQHDDATEEVQRQTLRQMQWMRGARLRVLKQLQQRHDQARATIEAEVESDLANEPLTLARQWLLTGAIPDGPIGQQRFTKVAAPVLLNSETEHAGGEGQPQQIVQKLRKAAARAAIPEAQRTTAMRRLSKLVADEGLEPDVVAEMFGLPSGEALVRGLVEAPTHQEAVDATVDQRMLEQHAELQDPKQLQDLVDKAVHNEWRGRMAAIEYKHVSRVTTPYRVFLAAAKQAAEQVLATKPLREIRPGLFAAAEARLAREAKEAWQRGDSQEVTRLKRQQMVQHELVRLAYEARQEVAGIERSFQKLYRPAEKLAKTRDFDLVMAARYVLGQYHVGTAEQAAAAKAYVERWQTYSPDRFAEFEPLLVDAVRAAPAVRKLKGGALSKPWKDLTLEQVRGIAATIETLWHRSMRDQQYELDGKKVETAALAQRLADRLREIGLPEKVAGETSRVTDRDENVRDLLKSVAIWTRVEHMLDALGPDWTKLVFRRVKDAADLYRAHRNAVVERFEDLVRQHRKAGHLTQAKIEAKELGPAGYTFANKGELLGALLHNGNESNRRRLLIGGRGPNVPWVPDPENPTFEDGTVDSSQLDALLSRAFQEGTLGQADLELLQKVWDQFEALKPDLQRVHRDLQGYTFNEIPAEAWSTPFGVFKGGYVPAAAERFLVGKARLQNQLAEIDRDIRQTIPSVPRNMTKERVENAARALALDIGRMSAAWDATLRYVYLQPAIKDVLHLLNHKDLAPVIERFNPVMMEKVILPWLSSTAHQLITEPSNNPAVDRFYTWARQNSSMAIMALSLSNAMQNLAGLTQAMVVVPPRFLWPAILHFIRNPAEAARVVAEESAGMADRLHKTIFELQERINEAIDNRSGYANAKKFARDHAYILQRMTQNPVDIIVWIGAKEQALVELGKDVPPDVAKREAIARADAAVRMTQGSPEPEDVSALERGTPGRRLLLQFYPWFGNWLNLNTWQSVKAVRELGWRGGSPRLFAIFMLGMMVPTALASLIANAVHGQLPVRDDDGDGYSDEWLSWFFGTQLRAVAASLPMVGQLGVTAWNILGDDKRWNDRFPSLPSVSIAERGLKALGGLSNGVTGYETRDLLTFLSQLSGWPVSAVSAPVGAAVDAAHGR